MTDERPSHLAHHFTAPQQQFEAGKLGMWLFLATEVLFFGGLFCAYAVYRGNHPDIFIYAHRYLDVTLGGINTIVLICSSLTMALAVHAAQCSRQRRLIVCLALTLLCACGFLGVKYIEYEHKWKYGLLPGTRFAPELPPAHSNHTPLLPAPQMPRSHNHTERPQDVQPPSTGPGSDVDPEVRRDERSAIPRAANGPSGLAPVSGSFREQGEAPDTPHNVHIFFGIYFAMTGLHALHVLAGMVVLAWLLVRSIKGHFHSGYFTPVDFGGLYWHLVDMIWIFLFPLLYLIH